MRPLGLAASGGRLSVLCIGAHSDDIEIGAGATILGWIDRGVRLDVHWAVLSASGPRADEAHASALGFLGNAATAVIDLEAFKDGFFPHQKNDIKLWFERCESVRRPM
jgi:LmbE family N-acetylglucosaminyl deacetylase